MKKNRKLQPIWRKLATSGVFMRLSAVMVLVCVGCAVVPPEDPRTRAAALLDAYLVAHGMAAGYAQSPDADPAVVVQLMRLDSRAATSMSKRDMGATAEAVAALTDYAAVVGRDLK